MCTSNTMHLSSLRPPPSTNTTSRERYAETDPRVAEGIEGSALLVVLLWMDLHQPN